MTVYTKISELPTAGALADSDVLIINDANITSKFTYGTLKVAIKDYIVTQDLTFAGTVALQGVPTAPTAGAGTNTTQIATTEFVTNALSTSGVASVNTRTGAVVLTAADVGLDNCDNTSDADKPVSTATQIALDDKAPLASPALTGTPVAPTATAGTNTTQIATTAFVLAEIAADNATDALLASPALTGTPTAPTATAGTNTTQIATTEFVTSAVAAGGGTSFEKKPVATAVNAVSVNQGELWTAVQTVDQPWPNLSWYFYNYTGTANSFNQFSTSGTVGGIENTPGNYTIKGRAAWPFGISDEITINVTVTAFTLNQDNLFGGITGMQGTFDFFPNAENNYLAITGAVVRDGGNFVFDNGSIVADSANCIAFYSYTEDILVAFRYDASNAIEFVYRFYDVTSLPTQNDVMPSSGSFYVSLSSIDTAANASSVYGKRVPLGSYQGGIGGTHFLSITPSGTEFNNFGSSGSDWSYGFVLADDWVSGGTANQLLSPTGSDYFVNTIVAYAIGSSPVEKIVYGDESSGPFTSSSTGTSWDIATDSWLLGSAGDMVIVTFNGTSNTWNIYVEGVLKATSTSLATYMSATTTVTELRLGDPGGSNETDYPLSYDELGGWPFRISSIFVANGTEFDQTAVSEIVTDKADITTSDNYGSVTTYATIAGGGVTSVKGSATYARGDVSFPLTRAAAFG